MRRASGRITLVWTEEVTTTLTQDEAAAATVLHVDDASVFNDDDETDEDGNLGYLRVGTQVVGYTAVDDDTSTVTLAEALAEDAEQDDDVAVWSDHYDMVDTVQWALVDPAGRGDKADLIQAIVDDSLELVDGDRGRAGESCVLERESGSDEWTVMGVGGRPVAARGPKWEADDAYTLTAGDVTAGEFTFQLTHVPIAESVQATAAGVTQETTEYSYTRDGLVTWPLDGFELEGDVFWFHYQYLRGPQTPSLPTPIQVWDFFDRADLYEGAHKSDDTRPPWMLGPANASIAVGFAIDAGVLYPEVGSAGEILTVDGGGSDGVYSFTRVGADNTNDQDDRVAWRVSDDGKTGFQMTMGGLVVYFDTDVDVIGGGVYNGGGDGVGAGVSINDGAVTQIVLDGPDMHFYTNGVFNTTLTDARNQTATRYGFATSDATPGTRGWDDLDFTVAMGP